MRDQPLEQPPTPVDGLVAEVLGVPISELTDATAFRSTPQWDSLRHVELMLALEEAWDAEIGPDLVAELTSLAAIRAHASRTAQSSSPDKDEPVLHRGLSGVYLDETEVSGIDGEAGRLTYRGYGIGELVAHSTFEETSFLLIHGRLPTAGELERFARRLEEAGNVPEQVKPVLEAMRATRPIVALRTGVSALAPLGVGPRSIEEMLETGIEIVGRVPALIAGHHRIRTGAPELLGPGDTYATRLLRVLASREPTEEEVRTFDRCLILLAEHGSNASAFAGRVVIGTRADLHAATTAAIAAFAGALHGGAIQNVTEMIAAIGTPHRARTWVGEQRARREPVFGFGHRLYSTEDPRARHLRTMAESLSRAVGDMQPFLILEEVRRAMHAHTRYGVDVNVDLYAGLVFSLLGIPDDLFIPVFAAARTAGWIAQALEQHRRNVLIRPLLRYTGPERAYVPLEARAFPGDAGMEPPIGADRA